MGVFTFILWCVFRSIDEGMGGWFFLVVLLFLEEEGGCHVLCFLIVVNFGVRDENVVLECWLFCFLGSEIIGVDGVKVICWLLLLV